MASRLVDIYLKHYIFKLSEGESYFMFVDSYNFLWKIKNKIFSFFIHTTIGARALVVKDNKILLVKHTYTPGWYSVGGGVDKGELPIEAVERELMEEVGVTCLKKPKLFNIYLNNYAKKDDYVALYVVEEFIQEAVYSPEILAMEWFAFNNLPTDISPATRIRIEEYLGDRVLSEKW